MQQEEFLRIVELRRLSGLTIKEFCQNEAYSVSSYHYWRRKFCSFPHHDQDERNSLVPVSLTQGGNRDCIPEASSENLPPAEISIEFPSGCTIRLKGMSESELTLRLLTQICNAHVLPE